MTDIYFDIETAPAYESKEEYLKIQHGIESGKITKDSLDREIKQKFWKRVRGALNPIEGKIIMITYQINDNPTKQLKEWESSEKHILEDLYTMMSALKGSKEDPLNLIGFNITNFDLPFVFVRSRELQIKNGFNGHDPLWLYKRLHTPTIQDIMQIHLPLNDYSRYGLNHNAVAMAYGFPVKEVRGDVNTEYYYNGECEKIVVYSNKEFIYPQLFKKMKKEGLVPKEKLQECVKFFQDKFETERQVAVNV
jgi:predicted PolB exonuclease-like 3'-5' exonuclease